MKKLTIYITLCTIFTGSTLALATETENQDFRVLPAPGKVVIDGKFDDWNLKGSLFICSDVENYRDQFASWQSAMYDKDNLYLLTRWADTTPLNNPGLAGSDMGFAGDCLQVRFIVGHNGKVEATGDDATLNQKTTHLSAWRGRDGRDIIDIAYGKKFDEGGIKDASKEGAKQAFALNADGKGYVQEISIPWKLLTRDGQAPEAGDSMIMTFEPNFSTDSKMRITTKDLFRPGVTPDRVFAFMANDRWGPAEFEAKGDIQPLPLRLADGRTFPVKMENNIPTVEWKGLYKEDKMEGFTSIPLTMPEDGFVSLIIKNSDGEVVRNLLNAKFLTKGAQEVLWDGLTTPSDRKPGDPVPAGNYTWEAIWHKGIGLSMVGWAANGGKAPFDSPGGNWGGDQGNPSTVDSDGEQVYLGWSSSEAGKALVCTDLEGNVKWRHKRGGFGGAALVSSDKGTVYVYDAGQENTLYRLDANTGDYTNWQGATEATIGLGAILTQFKPATADAKEDPCASGIAAVNGKIYVSYGSLNAPWGKAQSSGNVLLVLDGGTGKLIKKIQVDNPGDLKVGADGNLYLIAGGSNIAKVNLANDTVENVISGLKNVRAVAADKDGNIYAGLTDPDNQVKVFDNKGKALRTIGKAGGRNLTGIWDKSGMRFINSLKIDSKGKLWVMENDAAPRRISVWDAQTGAFQKEFFGPTDYGASGGAICPSDPYTVIGQSCEWKISPETGKAQCVAVIARTDWANARFGTGKDGRIYAAVGGGWGAGVRPVKIYERLAPGQWKFRSMLSPEAGSARVWADRNDDQKEQPDEVKKYDIALGGWIDGWYLYFNQAMTFSGGQYRLDVTGWTPCGAPEYDLTKALKLPTPSNIAERGGMGAQKGLVSENGRYVLYNGLYGVEHSDFSEYDTQTGKKVFSYPNNYVGVHGGHLAPPGKVGLIRAAYDIVGTASMPAPLNDIYAIGTDKGEWHLLSSSGYYVTKLFEGDPMKIKWPEESIPGISLNTVPPGMGAEDFGGSMTRANDGTVYIQAGKTAFINCKVTGLDTVKALGNGSLKVAPEDIAKAQGFKVKYLQVADGAKSVSVARKVVAFTGNPDADFGTKATSFGPDNARSNVWLAHDDENLYAAWQVEDNTPWVNGATSYENMYANGDTVDLQLGTDPNAEKSRGDAVKGDLRLSIGQLGGKDVAVIYRRVSDEKAPRTFYSGTSKGGYKMEFVKILDNVKIQAKRTDDKHYIVEVAVPVENLGVALKPGLKLRGDFGVTYSDPTGGDTNLRVYWSNQATGIVADEVEELKMQPSMWGDLSFE